MDNNLNTNENVNRESNGKLFVIIVLFLLFIIGVVGVSLATVVYTKESDKTNTICTGNIYLNYLEDNNGISITDAEPMTDDLGKRLLDENQYFDFSVVGKFKGNLNTKYEISVEKNENSTLGNDDVKLYLERKDGVSYVEVMPPTNFIPLKSTTKVGSSVGSMLLYTSTLRKSDTVNYRLRMWVDSDTEVESVPRSFSVRVVVKAIVDVYHDHDDDDHDHDYGDHDHDYDD